jgi:radical SAM protein with 4Fe4S-binding SPASM domain
MFVDKETNKCIAQKLAELNTKEIVLIGGEPFNHPFLGEIVDELIRSGLRSISILTNGTILNDSHCRMISDYGIELQISLDGASEETNAPTRGSGNFAKVVTNIERLRSIGASYSVMKTLTADNICNAKDFVDYCETHSIDYGFFVAKKVDDDVRPRQGSLFDLCVYLEKIGYDVFDALTCVKISEQMMFSQPGFPVTHCGAGISFLVVNPNADVFPCLKMLDDKDKFICNLMDDNSTELIRAYRKVLLKSDLVDNLPTCRECNIKYICGGGCRADRAFTAKNRYHYSQCATQRQSVDYFLEVLKDE